MVNVIVTQKNTLLINSSTYIIQPGEDFNINEDNIWYINTNQAPDFKEFQDEYESNKITMFVPENKYTTTTQEYKNTSGNLVSIEGMTDTHVNILSNAVDLLSHQIDAIEYEHFIFLTTTDQTAFMNFLTSDNSINSTQDILIPQHKYQYAYAFNMYIPLVKTFAITLNKNDVKYIVSNAVVINNNRSRTTSVPADLYTYDSFNTTLKKYCNNDTLWTNAYYSNNYYGGLRYVENSQIIAEGFGIIHTIENRSPTRFLVNQPPINRTINIKSSQYTSKAFCKYLTDNNFKSVHDNHFIYVQSDATFIFNPLTVLENPFMDKSTEFTSSKVLINTPHYQNITAFVDEDTIEGYYTPAELLRKISIDYNNPVTVINNSINFKNPINISCEWFECNGTEVTNNVGLSIVQDNLNFNNFKNQIVSLNGYKYIADSIIGFDGSIQYSYPELYGYNNSLVSTTSSIININMNINNDSNIISLNKSNILVYYNLSIINKNITVNNDVIIDNMNIKQDAHNSETNVQFYRYYNNIDDIVIQSESNVTVNGTVTIYQL